ncbi:DegT/DnrJ/EryC1/StrS family aminotransferase [Patescibacteria group bacterium]|nr:DegT/DnrJ/EryC1/StrS family aminotransferase [Patescibacteria group bacterium]
MRDIRQMEPWLGKEEEDEIIKVLKSGWITEAVETKKLESEIAHFVGSTYASLVTNGTVSLAVALMAVGIARGDEVIVPDFTMVATPNAVYLAGAEPVLADIDRSTLCLDPNALDRHLTRKTKAIIPVALNGRAPDMRKLMLWARRHNLFVIEDAAQAFGSTFGGKYLGTYGDIGSFSFSTPKVITTGQGGALVTDDKRYYERIIRLKDFGRINRNSQEHDEIGFNFKFTDIQAAIGVAQMGKLSVRLKRKKEMYALYRKELEAVGDIRFLETDLREVAPWFIDIFVPDPVSLKKYLQKFHIGTREFYPAIHTTPPYKNRGAFPNSLWAARHGLWLPSSSFLSDSDIIMICRKIRTFYGRP